MEANISLFKLLKKALKNIKSGEEAKTFHLNLIGCPFKAEKSTREQNWCGNRW
jgi:hypothetical protein